MKFASFVFYFCDYDAKTHSLNSFKGVFSASVNIMTQLIRLTGLTVKKLRNLREKIEVVSRLHFIRH